MYKIALDGPPGTGKSTLAKSIAKSLGIRYLDSGAIYRAFTLYCILKKVDTNNKIDVIDALDAFDLDISDNKIKISGVDYTDEIRKTYVSSEIWKVAANRDVRKYIVNYCKNYAKGHSVVMDGRDIGSEVFPESPHKFYLNASLDVRAERRLKDLKKNGEDDVDIEELKRLIAERETIEKTRPVSPLRKLEDAYEIDSSDKSVEELTQEVIEIIKTKEIVDADNCR